jgi:hypothetical protein
MMSIMPYQHWKHVVKNVQSTSGDKEYYFKKQYDIKEQEGPFLIYLNTKN